MKAVLLAGGTGTRLMPCSAAVNKHLLPVHDQPVIYYPLALLMAAGIREIALVVAPADLAVFQRLLGDGGHLGINITYLLQPRPLGIAEAVARAASFVEGNRFCVMLGDGLFLTPGIGVLLSEAMTQPGNAVLFGYRSDSPEDFAVLELDAAGEVVAIQEKPSQPSSSWVAPGLYVYDSDAFARIAGLQPSVRGELEISDLNQAYLLEERLVVKLLSSPGAWLDLGTFDRLRQAAEQVRAAEAASGVKPGCPERVAWENGWIDTTALERIGTTMASSPYGAYLLSLARNKR